jgi:hypothetical protein
METASRIPDAAAVARALVADAEVAEGYPGDRSRCERANTTTNTAWRIHL